MNVLLFLGGVICSTTPPKTKKGAISGKDGFAQAVFLLVMWVKKLGCYRTHRAPLCGCDPQSNLVFFSKGFFVDSDP